MTSADTTISMPPATPETERRSGDSCPAICSASPYYKDAWVTLYHADCRELIGALEYDHAITDPPYADDTHKNARTTRIIDGKKTGVVSATYDSINAGELYWIFGTIGKRAKRWVIAFMDWRHIAAFEKNPPSGLRFVRMGCWLKKNYTPQLSGDRPAMGWDSIAIMHKSGGRMEWNGGGQSATYHHAVVVEGHPAVKPSGMMEKIVTQFTDAGETILDPFAGSGTTLAACKLLGRHAIGIERDEKYCEVIARRCAQDVMTLDVGRLNEKS